MYSAEFIKAFNHAMIYEVGGWFDPSLPAVQQGLCNNKANRRAVGYVNDPVDRGGETKFGIAQRAQSSDVCVATLTLAQAQKIYFERYWLLGKCDKMLSPLSLLHFDTCVNMGVGAAAKLLQASLGVVADGAIGPQTLASANAHKDISALCSKYLDLKQARYDAIIAKNPSQARFAKGWRSRNDAMRTFLKVK